MENDKPQFHVLVIEKPNSVFCIGLSFHHTANVTVQCNEFWFTQKTSDKTKAKFIANELAQAMNTFVLYKF